jgi:uncharacterized protein
MHPDIQALLDLQADDVVIAGLETRIRAIEPRLRELDTRRAAISAALAQSRTAVEAEEKRRGEVQNRVVAHRQLQERNTAALDAVKKMKEATAAMAQVEVTRKIIADEEAEIAAIGRRLTELKQTAERQAETLASMDEEQAETRRQLSEERASLLEELSRAKAQRDGTSSRVARPLLGKYDRIRGRRVNAVYALREQSCGHCDTAIPLQRRNVMLSGAIEVCEACGVLLYSAEGSPSRS